MDEITLLARALPDVPPPSARTVARARARLAADEDPAWRPGSRRNWSWTAGAAITTAGVVSATVLLVSNLSQDSEPGSSPAAAPPAYQQAPRVYHGLDQLATARAERSATKITLRFRPTSKKIAIVVFCQEPGSIFYDVEQHDSGWSSSSGQCGPDGGLSKLTEKAWEKGWLGRDHKVTFYVFPPDAPIALGRTARRTCPSRGLCDGKYELGDPDTADQLLTKLGEHPGAWSVAAYDAPTTSPTG